MRRTQVEEEEPGKDSKGGRALSRQTEARHNLQLVRQSRKMRKKNTKIEVNSSAGQNNFSHWLGAASQSGAD